MSIRPQDMQTFIDEHNLKTNSVIKDDTLIRLQTSEELENERIHQSGLVGNLSLNAILKGMQTSINGIVDDLTKLKSISNIPEILTKEDRGLYFGIFLLIIGLVLGLALVAF